MCVCACARVPRLAALAEGMALAEELALSPSDLQAVLDDGAMASPMVGLKGPLMSRNEYAPAFPLKYALKDCRFALELPEASKLALDVSRAATASYAAADEEEGLGESDFAAVMEVARRAAAS